MEKNRVFGGKCYESLASYQQDQKNQSWSWKMSQLSLFAEDVKSLDRLPKSGIAQNGQLYPLEIWVPVISGEDGLLLPTPTATANQACKTMRKHWKGYLDNHKDFGDKTRLSPHFVEWMMGFPIGWTDLER